MPLLFPSSHLPIFPLPTPVCASSMEQKLNKAAKNGRTATVRALLGTAIDVNQRDRYQFSALHNASYYGHAEIVELLLAHPAINVNILNAGGATPFSLSCNHGYLLVVRLMLKDSRVDVSLADNHHCSPLWRASLHGYHEVIEWLIASGRDLGDLNAKGNYAGQEFTPLEIATVCHTTEVMSLLERFMANSSITRIEVRRKLGLLDELTLFAVTVFLCDDLLQLQPATNTTSGEAAAIIRFLGIAKRVPMELQMILCLRAVGSMKHHILRKNSEAAFRYLAKIL